MQQLTLGQQKDGTAVQPVIELEGKAETMQKAEVPGLLLCKTDTEDISDADKQKLEIEAHSFAKLQQKHVFSSLAI